MPLYDLFCGKCGHQDEYLVRSADAPLPDCPECESQLEKQAVHLFGINSKTGRAEPKHGYPISFDGRTMKFGDGCSVTDVGKGDGRHLEVENKHGRVFDIKRPKDGEVSVKIVQKREK